MSSSDAESDTVVAGGQDENVQKFIVLTSKRCNSHGWGLSSGDAPNGSTVLMVSSSSAPSFQTTRRLSRPCLMEQLSIESTGKGPFGNLRDDLVVTPTRYSKYRVRMCPPDGSRPHNGQIPDDDEALGVSCYEAVIAPDEGGCMDLSLVSS